ncbi:hypothetical protein CK203_017991 [Vitis vinifera]|uniref:Uncharacterized protein n=1 Tax=Vitis vinifera TaxID=29760 RepID=A0A438JVU2_VITVI|nr:hypothetical protein CK203_017991 [Vitis vinifera]
MSFQDKVKIMLASMESKVEPLLHEWRLETKRFNKSWPSTRQLCRYGSCTLMTHKAPRVEVPKPHMFNGKRDAKELDNFLWHMERYFEALH